MKKLILVLFASIGVVSNSLAVDWLLTVSGNYLSYHDVTNAIPKSDWPIYGIIDIPISMETQNLIDSKADSAAMTTALAGKLSTPTGTTNQYIDGTGVLRTAPLALNGTNGATGSTGSQGMQGVMGLQGANGSNGSTGASGSDGELSIQRIRVQTDATGNYTWTFPSTFGSGVLPIVSANAEGVSTTQINIQIVSSTRSNAVFKVYSLPTQSLLGISVAVPTATQAFIDLMAIAP